MRRILLVLLLSLPAVLLAVGTNFVGQKPPELQVREWLNTKEGYRLSELRGKAVLLDFWATWCPPCRRAMPHLQKLYEKYSKKGLIVIALSAETRSKVEPFIKQNRYTFPVALDDSRKTNRSYGIKSIPTTYLLGPTGRVVWQGNPLNKELDGVVEKVMRDVEGFASDKLLALEFELTIEKELSKRLKTALRYAKQGKYASAVRTAAKVLKSGKASDEEKKDATYLVERIELHGERLLAKAELLIEKKRYLEAEELLKRIDKAFSGSDISKRASKDARRLRTDKVISKELRAAKALDTALKKLKSGNEEEVKKELEKLIADYPGTEAAKKAEGKLKELQSSTPKGESGASPKKP